MMQVQTSAIGRLQPAPDLQSGQCCPWFPATAVAPGATLSNKLLSPIFLLLINLLVIIPLLVG